MKGRAEDAGPGARRGRAARPRRRGRPRDVGSWSPRERSRAIVDDAREWAADRVDDARDVVERHGTIFRYVWVATGFVVVAAGIAMIVFPGPVTVVIPLGLVMLAAVYGWARTALLRTVEHGEEATRRFRDASRPVQVLTTAASMCVAAAVIAWMVL